MITDHFRLPSLSQKRTTFSSSIVVVVFDYQVMLHVFFKYSCFDKGCPTKSVKAYATMPIGIMVVRVWLCLIKVQGDSATRNEKDEYVFVLFPSTTLK